MQGQTLTKNQHVLILVLLGLALCAFLLIISVYLNEFWFGVAWVVLGLGGWSFQFERKKTPIWAIVPSAILGAAAMIHYLGQFISEE